MYNNDNRIKLDEIRFGNPWLTYRLQGTITERRLYMCRPIPGTLDFVPVAIFAERMDEGCQTEYIIKPIWSNYEKYGLDEYSGEIFGIDMYNKREEYIYEYLPATVAKRIPPKNTDNWAFLSALNIQFWDPIEILEKTNGIGVDKIVFFGGIEPRDIGLYMDNRSFINKFKLDISDLNVEQIFHLKDEQLIGIKNLYLMN